MSLHVFMQPSITVSGRHSYSVVESYVRVWVYRKWKPTSVVRVECVCACVCARVSVYVVACLHAAAYRQIRQALIQRGRGSGVCEYE